MTDTLNVELRHTIRLCWKSLRGQQALKAVQIDTGLAAMLPDEFSPSKQITNTWACGSSANRLCEILVGDALQDYTSNADAVDIADATKTSTQLIAMAATTGRLLVRLNIIGGEAGHSYIFISHHRAASDGLAGLIYQTNVGCHQDSAFDLMAWIDDPKSWTIVDLPAHLQELGADLAGLADPSGAYQRNFMLSSKALTPNEVKALTTPKKPARVIFMWRPIDVGAVSTRLEALRDQASGAVNWPAVKTDPKAYRSTG